VLSCRFSKVRVDSMAMTLDGEAFRKASLRDDVAALLRERRFDDALAMLYKARATAPTDSEIEVAIGQLKEFMVTTCARQLGGLDKVAPTLPSHAAKTPAAIMVGQYVNGRTTYGDIAQVCPLGQLRTLQVLVELYVKAPTTEHAPPSSGLRTPKSEYVRLVEAPTPHTARSDSRPASTRPPSVSAVPTIPSMTYGIGSSRVDSEADRCFKDLFASGTSAFVQGRFRDAVDAFQECLKLRPEDKSVEVMLRRSLKDLQEQLR
jgi:hypothetical protein